MATITFILSFILGTAMLVGLIKPDTVLKFTNNPSRGKVLFFFGIPAFLMFIIFGMLHESPLDMALKNPENTLQLKLNTGRIHKVPEEVAQLTNLEILDLNNNKITKLPEFVRNFKKLEVLDLSRNPIDHLPAWLANLPSLKEINLYQTQITQLPVEFGHLDINYKDTPLWKSEHPEIEEPQKEPIPKEDDNANEDHTESIGEFAMRKFLGKDYGYRRKFLKGEIFYNHPISQKQADQVGEIMQTMGFFNNDKTVSMLLDKREDIFELKMVIDQSQQIDEQVRDGFLALKNLVQMTAFPTDSLHLHLTDGEFDTIKIIK